MVNNIILTGNLGRDPEIRITQDGRQLARFSLATSSKWKDEEGEWHTWTQWHKIVVYREPTIRWIKDVLKKGHRVRVEGALTYHHWKDSLGYVHRIASIVVTGQYGRVEQLESKNPKELSSRVLSSPPEEPLNTSEPEDSLQVLDLEKNSFTSLHETSQTTQ